MLYLGIGTGRLAVPLERAGVRLVGLDVHPGMLARARERLPGVELVEAAIEDLRLARRFDLVMAPSGILCTAERLRRAAAHTTPGGRLAFELMNPHWLSLEPRRNVRVLEVSREHARIEVDYRLPGEEPYTQEARVPLIWPEAIEGWLRAAGLALEILRGRKGHELASSPTFYVLAQATSR